MADSKLKGITLGGIVNEVYEIKQLICRDYCKYTEIYEKKYPNDSAKHKKAMDDMYNEHCNDCPLNCFVNVVI